MPHDLQRLEKSRLWLVFERVPHPDAVAYSASKEDVRFALDLLQREEADRLRIGQELSVYLSQMRGQNPFQRPQVPVRSSSGLYHLVPWRFAKWLSLSCRVCPSARERTCRRLEAWLAEQVEGALILTGAQ